MRIRNDPQSGIRYSLCPFCHTQTETFMHFPDGSFACLSCGIHGDAHEYGLLCGARPAMPVRTYDNKLFAVYETAAEYYAKSLNARAYRYLKSREMTGQTLKQYRIGYAPKEYRIPEDFRKYPEALLLRSGLFRKWDNGSITPFFRDRIMFPIIREDGHIVAFGGRRIGDGDEPKYLNTQETNIFSKRNVLYGLHAEPKTSAVFICEGYMDLIAAQNSGVIDAAAVLGTALTDEHAEILKSRYKGVYLGLDSDAAGRYAMRRSIGVLKRIGIPVRIAEFSPHKDPDEFIREEGAEAFSARLKKSLRPDVFMVRAATNPGELATAISEFITVS